MAGRKSLAEPVLSCGEGPQDDKEGEDDNAKILRMTRDALGMTRGVFFTSRAFDDIFFVTAGGRQGDGGLSGLWFGALGRFSAPAKSFPARPGT